MGSDSTSESEQLPTSNNHAEVSIPPTVSDEESPSHGELPLSTRTENEEYGSPTEPYEALRIASDSD